MDGFFIDYLHFEVQILNYINELYSLFFFFLKCEVHIMFMCTKTKSNNSSINFSLFQYLNKIIIQFAIIKYKKNM